MISTDILRLAEVRSPLGLLKMNESRDYVCLCGKLLAKGYIFNGEIQIKCKRCGRIHTITDIPFTSTKEGLDPLDSVQDTTLSDTKK